MTPFVECDICGHVIDPIADPEAIIDPPSCVRLVIALNTVLCAQCREAEYDQWMERRMEDAP